MSIVQYARQHWHGQHSLSRSLLFNGILMYNVVLYAVGLPLLAAVWMLIFRNGNLVAAAVCTILLMAISILVACWAKGGVLASAWKRRKKQPFSSLLAGIVALLSLGILAIALIKTIPVSWKAMHLDAHSSTAQHTIQNNGRRLVIRGMLTATTVQRIINALETRQEVSTLAIGTLSGLALKPAETLAKHIRQRRLNTVLSGRCRGTCAMVFLAGKYRLAAPGASLELHRMGLLPFHLPLPAIRRKTQKATFSFLQQQGVRQECLNTLEQAFSSTFPPRITFSATQLYTCGFVTHLKTE